MFAETRRALSTTRRVGEIFSRKGFRRFFTTRLISQFGDGVFQLAAASAFIFEDPGTNPAMDTLLAAAITLIPFSLIGPFTGVFIDRWERRTILSWVPAVRAVLAAMAPLAALGGAKGAAFVAIVIVVLSSNRFFLATMSAVLPQLVPEDDLVAANAVATTGGSVANVAGLAVGAGLAGLLDGTTASAFAAVPFAAAAAMARLIPVHRGFEEEPAPLLDEIMRVLRELRAGISMLQRSSRSVFALSSISTMQLLVGVMTGAITVFFIGELGMGIEGAARLLVFLSAGIFVGVIIVPAIANRIAHDRLVPASFLIASVVTAVVAVAPTRLRVDVATAFVGVSYAFVKIPVDTIIQQEMPDAFRGRAFAVYDMLFNLARVVGIAITAVAIEAGSDSTGVIRGLAAVGLGVTGWLWWCERRVRMFGRRKDKQRAPSVEDLLLPGELVTVRSYAGARADEEPRTIVVGGRELPIEGIDWRAIVETDAGRSRVFVVRVGGRRIRLAQHEDQGWEIERLMPEPPAPPGASDASPLTL